ncbi:MAG TPA: CsgG/HfaB family protein [Spirochaetota bacterium]|nr:CsgG/HfaB family protein [Spirochaetota bacterium]
MFLGKKALSIVLVLLLSFVFSCSSQDKAKTLRNTPRELRKGLLILNFYNSTPKSRASEFEPWEYGLASMLMTDMESIGVFNIISKEALKDVIAEQEFQQTGMIDPKTLVKLGNLVGAQYILKGSFMEMNGMLRIETQVFSVEKGVQLQTAVVNGKTDTFFTLEKELVDKITQIVDVVLTESEKNVILAKIETKSVEASLKNYKGELTVEEAKKLAQEGKKEEAKKLIEQAKKDFKEAVAIDPNYEKAKKNLSKISMAIPVTL